MEAGLQTLGGSGRTVLPDSIYRVNPNLSPGVAGMQAGSSNASRDSSQNRNILAHSPVSDSLPSPQQTHRWFHGSGRSDGPGRTSSLTSAFSGFSRGMRRGKREDRSGGKKGKRDEDDDEDVILEGDSSNIVTYQDITLLRNSGGNKYGYGAAMDDTTPIIPTVVTREHKNMNNIEYRKHMVSQKKMALTMAARQNSMQDAGAPRAMSLQTIGPRPAFDQNMIGGMQTHPGPFMQQYGSRANSLATTPVSGGGHRPDVPPFGMSYYSPGPIPGQGPVQRPSGNNAMSFTGRVPYARMAPPYGGNAGPRGFPPDSYRPQYPQHQPPLNYQGPPQSHFNYQGPQYYPQHYNPQQQIPVGPRSQSFQGPARVMPEHIRQPSTPSAPPITPGSYSSQASSISVGVDSMTRSNGGTPDSTCAREGDDQERALSLKSPLQHEIQRTRSGTSEVKLNVVKLADQKQKEIQLATIQEFSSPKKDDENGEVSVHHQVESDAARAEELGTKIKEQSSDVETRPVTVDLDLNPSNLLVDSVRMFGGDDTLDFSKDDDSFPWIKDPLASGPQSRTSESEGSSSVKPVLSLKDTGIKPVSSAGEKDDSLEIYPRKESGNNTFVSAAELSETLKSKPAIKEPSVEEKNGNTPQLARIWRVAGNGKDVKEKENGFMRAKNFLRKISTGRSKNQSATKTPSPSAAHSSNAGLDSVAKAMTNPASSSSKSLKSGNNGSAEKMKNSGTSIESHAHRIESVKSTPLRKQRSFQSLFSGTSTPTQRLKSSSAAPIGSEERSIRSQSISETHAEDPHASAGVTYSNSSGSTSQTGKHSKLYRHEGSSEARLDSGSTSDSSIPENLYVPSFAKGVAELEPAMIISSSSRGRKFQTISISPEQMNILTSNKELMNDLHIISQELVQSIARETRLEQQLYSKHNKTSESNSFCLMDFEVELRKKSAKIVELIQGLNEERLKRFIAEEQVLLTENGAKPNSLDLIYKINLLQKELEIKTNEIRQLRERIATN